MGARGPAPTPTPILKARGSWRAKLNKAAPAAPAGEPERPACLTGAAAAEWNRITPILAGMGLLSPADQAALAVYCVAWGSFVAAVEAGDVRTSRQAGEGVLKAAAQFGLTPSARARVQEVERDQGQAAKGKARFFAAG